MSTASRPSLRRLLAWALRHSVTNRPPSRRQQRWAMIRAWARQGTVDQGWPTGSAR